MLDIRRFILILLMSAVAFSCTRNRYPDELVAADSIADTNPSEALKMLGSFKRNHRDRSEAVDNYCSLLCIKAADKDYMRHTSDSVILRLVAYYEENGDKQLLPTAYYYAGSVYRDLNDASQAIDYFQKAADDERCDDALKRRAYSQVADLMTCQGLYGRSLEIFKRIYDSDMKTENKGDLYNDLTGMAYCYRCMHNDSLAKDCFFKALNVARSIGDKFLEGDMFTQIANCYYKEGNYKKAEQLIKIGLERAGDSNITAALSIASNIYDKLGYDDTVRQIHSRLMSINSVYTKKKAYRYFANYDMARGDYAGALRNLKGYEDCLDSIQSISATQAVENSNSLYNYRIREKDNTRLRLEIEKKRADAYMYIGGIAAVILAFAAYYVFNRKKRQIYMLRMENLERLHNEGVEQSKRFIEENKKEIDLLRSHLHSFKDRNDDLALQLKMKETQLLNLGTIAEMRLKNIEIANEELKSSPIIRKITDTVRNDDKLNGNMRLSADEWEMLDSEVNRCFPDFKKRIADLCKINTDEYRICLLIKADVPLVCIASFMSKAKNTISSTRKRLYTKAFGKEGKPEDWDKFIRSL